MLDLLCPDCRLTLTAARLGPVPVHACRSCGGAWFPEGQLRAVAAAGDGVVRKLAEHLRAARNAVPPPPALSPACPECHQPLLSNPSATLTGVEVRACIPCKGHWAPMRSLQILASRLTPRTLRQDKREAVSARNGACLPSWKVTGPCPRCLGDRQIVECSEMAVEVCSDCGGAWLQEAASGYLQSQTHLVKNRLLAQIKSVRSGRHRKPQRELLCPTCGLEMTASGRQAPGCPKCASCFVDFYSLPAFLGPAPDETRAPALSSEPETLASVEH
jgi:Zn-finger nucleic acid-binding protein